MSMLYRKSDEYKKKLMRIGRSLRQFSNVSGMDNNTNSLAKEVEALEEVSLSAFSLMKAIKRELEWKGQRGLILTPSEPSSHPTGKPRIIAPLNDNK